MKKTNIVALQPLWWIFFSFGGFIFEILNDQSVFIIYFITALLKQITLLYNEHLVCSKTAAEFSSRVGACA